MSRNVVKINEEDDDLYCTDCKHKIKLGEKYIIQITDELGDEVSRPYHLDCVPETEDEDDYTGN